VGTGCAANERDKNSKAAIKGNGWGFIVEFEDLKIGTNT
jgi:hypothetical protein